jgi:hypothetical protein
MKMGVEHWRNDTERRKPRHSEEFCPNATISTKNFTWNCPGSNWAGILDVDD